MTISGFHLIAGGRGARGVKTFTAANPATGETLDPPFQEGTPQDVDRAMVAAERAFASFRRKPGREIASFLDAIAAKIEALGDALLSRAQLETGLPAARLTGERARLVGQARAFAAMAREGSWVGARIDHGDPARTPLPKPDVRTMLIGIGPVAVFGASNFPLAISVAGTDTVSALAAGCPVVVKAHPGHPGTSELVGAAITAAAAETGMPEGVFSLVQGAGTEVGLALVRHRATRAVAFTGSLRGGRALFDAAAARPDPIPVYAEMGSVNPVLVLPGALAERGADIGRAYVASVTMGVGQFCTNPGLVLGIENDALDEFIGAAATAARAIAPATMLHAGIQRSFSAGVERIARTSGVTVAGRSEKTAAAERAEAGAVLFTTTAERLAEHPHLTEEVFGPASVIVRCTGKADLERVVRDLDGHLVASVHATARDLEEHADLIALLETKVGRIVMNGFGTGIEVCAAMHHGGPYPATTFPAFTSIGHAAIFRFARPICYQGFPQTALPEALRDGNPLGLWRLVDNGLTRDAS